jgi:hypothetical protein
MFNRCRFITLAALASIATLAAPMSALARPQHGGVQFSVSPIVQLVQPGGNVQVAWTVNNNTSSAEQCSVTLRQTGYPLFSGLIAPGTSAGTGGSLGFSTPLLANVGRFTFVLACDGLQAQSRSVLYIVVRR